MPHIEVGWGFVQLDVEGIDDLAVTARVEGRYPLRIRSQIERLSVGIIEVEMEALRCVMQRRLEGVVATGADGGPSHQVHKLGIEVAVSHTIRRPWVEAKVEVEETGRFVAAEAAPLIAIDL